MLVVTDVMHEADQRLLNPGHLVVLLASWIPHNSIRLLIITTDLSHFTDLLDMSFSLSLHFLPVLSLETSVCLTLKFYPAFLGS